MIDPYPIMRKWSRETKSFSIEYIWKLAIRSFLATATLSTANSVWFFRFRAEIYNTLPCSFSGNQALHFWAISLPSWSLGHGAYSICCFWNHTLRVSKKLVNLEIIYLKKHVYLGHACKIPCTSTVKEEPFATMRSEATWKGKMSTSLLVLWHSSSQAALTIFVTPKEAKRLTSFFSLFCQI